MSDSNITADGKNDLHPAVAMYGPHNVQGLEEGQVKLWCACGLSKKQPWCDGSHKGTGFKPLRWTVPKQQRLFSICACKYTKNPPFCDATHTNLSGQLLEKRKNCPCIAKHGEVDMKLCTTCSWVPDF